MSGSSDGSLTRLQSAMIGTIRWRILKALDMVRTGGLTEVILGRFMEDLEMEVTVTDLRRDLKYLEEHECLHVKKNAEGTWFAEITSKGMDIVEYNADPPPGVHRPERF